ncbi:MAG: M23 family metallopeptidase [Bacteroidales bacterium]|jgi:hypothetical protein|nr:M23 family metallopeptidase [Bacteroidales bacterium]
MSRILLACSLLLLMVITTAWSLKPPAEPPTPPTVPHVTFDLPMRIQPLLSGNFGELRSNHFHSGIDFKTQQKTGIPVYAPADGWISRLRIGAYGFGYALYLDHPSGHTTVYGHLDRFASPIDSLATAQQYARESFELDTLYPPRRFPVKRGQLIAYSGNSGSSGGPHLHVEIRDAATQDILDPLIWYGDKLPDSRAPRIQSITLFAQGADGVIKPGKNRVSIPVVQAKNGQWTLKQLPPTVWGQVGLGIKAYDYMDNTSNIYGIRLLELYKGETLLFRQAMDRFAFADTRYLNALIDYEDWQRNRSLVMRSHLLPGNAWPNAQATNRGYFSLQDGETDTFTYVLTDRKGNSSRLTFTLKGERQALPTRLKRGFYLDYRKANVFKEADIELTLPKGCLYEDAHLRLERADTDGYADQFSLENVYTPLHLAAPLSLKIKHDTLSLKRAYYLAKRNKQGRWQAAGVGTYRHGWLTTPIRELGTFTVLADTVAPKITPVNLENAVKNRLFRIRVADEASGISSWRGTIDGQWVLFTYDIHTGYLQYVFDNKRLPRGQSHHLSLTVADACGNARTWQHSFDY